MLKITFEDLNKVQFIKRNIKISRFTVYSKIKQGRKFVYHSTAHSRSHEKGYHFSKTQSYGNGKKCALGRTRRGRQETTLFSVLFHYEYFKILLLYFKKYLGFKNLRLQRKIRKQAACCIVTRSNSIFFKRSLANIYYVTSSLRCYIVK